VDARLLGKQNANCTVIAARAKEAHDVATSEDVRTAAQALAKACQAQK
jgi:hypothetical protein